MSLDNNQEAFFELVRAGLWADTESTESRNHGVTEAVDWEKVYLLAGDQSVQGLVLAGIERTNTNRANNTNRPPQELLLQWIGEVQMLEQQNNAMNSFVAKLIEKLREADVYAIVVKGQGIAQCYERPMWRSSGDVDLFLDKANYEKCRLVLVPYAKAVEEEITSILHLAMTIDHWDVELHGTMRTELGDLIDNNIDAIQEKLFAERRIRTWRNGDTDVYLPAPDDDVIIVFTHILQHYFHGGIGLRQICDWCRLLWTYKNEIDVSLLETRLKAMGLLPKWKAFATLADKWLGMPVEAIPLYSEGNKWQKKANRIIQLVLESGNFGNGRDKSYKQKYPQIVSAIISFWRYFHYSALQFTAFPKDAVKGWVRMMKMGTIAF